MQSYSIFNSTSPEIPWSFPNRPNDVTMEGNAIGNYFMKIDKTFIHDIPSMWIKAYSRGFVVAY